MFMYHMYFVRCRYRSNPSSIFRATVNGVVQAWSSWDGTRIISRPAPCEVFPFWVSRPILSSLPFSGLRSITFVPALQTWEPRRVSGGQWDSNSSGKDLDKWVASEAVPSPSYLCTQYISVERAQRWQFQKQGSKTLVDATGALEPHVSPRIGTPGPSRHTKKTGALGMLFYDELWPKDTPRDA